MVLSCEMRSFWLKDEAERKLSETELRQSPETGKLLHDS